jgi:tetratricopeptide (TPR) repeat protein
MRNMNLSKMSLIKHITILVLGLFLTGCATTIPLKPKDQIRNRPNQKAVDYYLSGALYDFQEQYEKALLEYYQALLYDSTSAQILKAIGRNLIRIHRFESAKQYLVRSLKYNPKDKETLYFLAEAYFNMKDYENSAAYFEKLWELDPYNSSDFFGYEYDIIYQLYTLYVKSNEIKKAQNLIDHLIQSHPNQPKNWVLLGNLNETFEDTSQAIEAYKKALAMDPDNGEALIQLYQLMRSQNSWEELTEFLSTILERSPDNSEARLIMAEGLFIQKRYEESQQVLEPLLKKEVHQVHVYRLMGLIASEQNHLQQAEDFFKKITQIDPNNKFGWLSLALLYNQEQQFNNAIIVLQDALSHLPSDKDLLGIYGSTLNQVGRFEEAVKILENAYQSNPKDLNIIVSLGVAYEELKMYPESDSLHEAAIRSYPDEALLLNNYSYSLGDRGIHLERALEMAKKAITMDPENGAFLDTIGWIYFKSGNLEKAREYIEKAISKREDSAVVIEHLGDVYFKLGNLEKASEYWNQALQKDPDNEVLKKKIQDNEI